MSKKSFMFGMGLIAGVVGGIIAGVLYAPKPGEETRKEIKEAACKLYEENSPAISEAKKQALESIGKFTSKDYLNCNGCGYSTCKNFAIGLITGRTEKETGSPSAFRKAL